MTGNMITSELYGHLIIGTVCTSEDLIYTITSFITSCLQGTHSALDTWDFDFWETAVQQESN